MRATRSVIQLTGSICGRYNFSDMFSNYVDYFFLESALDVALSRLLREGQEESSTRRNVRRITTAVFRVSNAEQHSHENSSTKATYQERRRRTYWEQVARGVKWDAKSKMLRGVLRATRVVLDGRNRFPVNIKYTQTRKANDRKRIKNLQENAAIIREGREALMKRLDKDKLEGLRSATNVTVSAQ